MDKSVFVGQEMVGWGRYVRSRASEFIESIGTNRRVSDFF